MATAHWRTGYSVTDLYACPDADWSFHQLVRLLLPSGTGDDEILSQINANIDFKASVAMDFPPGAIRVVTPGSVNDSGANSKTQINCADHNIAGLEGPLPEPFVDMLRDNQLAGDGAMAAFIDLFNQRIQSLRYLIRARTDNTLASALAPETVTGQFLLALSGHLSEQQRVLHQQSSDTLIGLAGDLANSRMTLPTIRQLLQVALDLPLLELQCLLGRWLTVESCDHTLLGSANHRLGGEATLGKQIWDQQAAFELVIGPISASRLHVLVPGGAEHARLRSLVEWISDSRCDCKITLVCEKDIGTVTALSKTDNQTNSLGFGSWLSGKKNAQQRVSFMLNLAR
jgi:type VI secretion system protein ImpH